jgi:hypothetical protein
MDQSASLNQSAFVDADQNWEEEYWNNRTIPTKPTDLPKLSSNRDMMTSSRNIPSLSARYSHNPYHD